MSNKILLPLDCTQSCENSLDLAVIFAKQYQAEIHIIHNLPAQTFFTDTEGTYGKGGYCIKCPPSEEEIKRAKEFLSEAKEKIKSSSIKSSVRILKAERHAHEIVEYVKENNIDLVIMSSHGRQGLSRWWHGSVAERVLSQVIPHVPILFVKCGESYQEFKFFQKPVK